LGFLRRSGSGAVHKTREWGIHSGAYTAATKLLNFAAVLLAPSRIVWTVTNLQQRGGAFLRVAGATRRSGPL
jgi:hypothetical protein